MAPPTVLGNSAPFDWWMVISGPCINRLCDGLCYSGSFLLIPLILKLAVSINEASAPWATGRGGILLPRETEADDSNYAPEVHAEYISRLLKMKT